MAEIKFFWESGHYCLFLDKENSPDHGLISIGDGHTYSNRGIWFTTDAGRTWTKSFIQDTNMFPWAFTFKDSLTGWCCNSEFTSSYPHCWKTTDGGRSWFSLNNGRLTFFDFDIEYNKRDKNLFVFGGSSIIEKSSDE